MFFWVLCRGLETGCKTRIFYRRLCATGCQRNTFSGLPRGPASALFLPKRHKRGRFRRKFVGLCLAQLFEKCPFEEAEIASTLHAEIESKLRPQRMTEVALISASEQRTRASKRLKEKSISPCSCVDYAGLQVEWGRQFQLLQHKNLGPLSDLQQVFSEGRKWGVRSVVVGFGVFGVPRFSVQRSPTPIFKEFSGFWTENRGAPKTPNSTTTDLTPHLWPSDFCCRS